MKRLRFRKVQRGIAHGCLSFFTERDLKIAETYENPVLAFIYKSNLD
jgi:hypothetical protein